MASASYYLPYSIGCIWSYAQTSEYIRSNYQLDHVIWKRDPLDSVVEKFSNQDIVGFSVYVWNKNYSYALAKRIKEINPDCLIILGGPEPAVSDANFFKKHPYVDIIVKHEGELVFKDILENVENYKTVEGIIYNDQGTAVDTGKPNRIRDLEMLPSPYLTGFFDDMLPSPEVKEWSMTMETNRGCPYQCTFCDWGGLTYSKVAKFNLERVFAELEWAGKHKIYYISMADANFGIFFERDSKIIDKFIEVQKKYGYPRGFVTSYAKNQKKEVLTIIEKLVKESPFGGPGHIVSLQTLNENTLSIIKRKNLEVHNLSEILAIAEQKNVPVGTELILGLPGESLETWKRTIYDLFKLNIHSGIDIFFCQVLENTELNQVQKEIYNIQYKPNFDYFNQNLDQDQEIIESINVITGTSTMNQDDMIQAVIFNWFIMTLHSSGYSNFYSRYLYQVENIEYRDYYESFFEFLSKNSWFKNEIVELTNMYRQWLDHGTLNNATVNDVTATGWNLWYKTLFKISDSAELVKQLQDLSEEFFKKYSNNQDVIKIQRNYVVNYSNYQTFPKTVTTNTNIYNHLVLGKTLDNTPQTLEFKFQDAKDYDRVDFLEKLYFRRRRNFGKAWIVT